jgi:hypothetical protein
MDDYGVDLLEEAIGSSATPSDPVSSSHPFAKKDVPSLARYIESDACRQIYLMVQASVLLREYQTFGHPRQDYTPI